MLMNYVKLCIYSHAVLQNGPPTNSKRAIERSQFPPPRALPEFGQCWPQLKTVTVPCRIGPSKSQPVGWERCPAYLSCFQAMTVHREVPVVGVTPWIGDGLSQPSNNEAANWGGLDLLAQIGVVCCATNLFPLFGGPGLWDFCARKMNTDSATAKNPITQIKTRRSVSAFSCQLGSKYEPAQTTIQMIARIITRMAIILLTMTPLGRYSRSEHATTVRW